MQITDHAVERYISRISPGMSARDARAYLESESRSAVRMARRTTGGQLRYRLRDCILVVKDSRRDGTVAVTTLPAYPKSTAPKGAGWDSWALELERDTIALMAQWEAEHPEVADPEPIPEPAPAVPVLAPEPPAPVLEPTRIRIADPAERRIAHLEFLLAQQRTSLEREAARQAAHAAHVNRDREELREMVRRIRHFVPDTPENRARVAEFERLVFPTPSDIQREIRWRKSLTPPSPSPSAVTHDPDSTRGDGEDRKEDGASPFQQQEQE